MANKNKNSIDTFNGIIGKLTGAIFKFIGAVDNFKVKSYQAFDNFMNKQDAAVRQTLGAWEGVNKAASVFSKNVGLSSKAMGQFRDNTIRLANEKNFGMRYGISSEELMSQIQGVYNGTGRKVGISDSDAEEMAGMQAVIGKDKANEYITKLDAFGVSMKDASKLSGKMFAKAAKSGVDFQTYSENFLKNVEKAQTYNFKNGVKGVEAMAKKAAEMKFSIEEAAKFSDKVNNLEGALSAGAQLQALGGSFAQFSNPLEMLNESYTSVEDMYDRMVNMMGGHGKFNAKTGQVEVNGMDKKRIRLASEAMGVSYDEMMKGIHAKGRRDEIGKQLSSRGDLSNELKELIMNTGTFKDGRAGIVDQNGQFKDLSQITNADQKKLLELNRSESDDVKDIAMNMRTITDVIAGKNKDKGTKEAANKDVQRRALKDTEKYTSERYENRMNRQMRRLARRKFRANRVERRRLKGDSYSGFIDEADAAINIVQAPFKKAKGGFIGSTGGKVTGLSHKNGGVPFIDKKEKQPYELEGGEFVINKQSTKRYLPIIKEINNGSFDFEGMMKSAIGAYGKTMLAVLTGGSSLLLPYLSKRRRESLDGNNRAGNIDNSRRSERKSWLSTIINRKDRNVVENVTNNTGNVAIPKVHESTDTPGSEASGKKMIENISKTINGSNISNTSSSISNRDSSIVNNIEHNENSAIKPDVKKLSPVPVTPSAQSPKPEIGGNRNISIEPLNINFSGTIKVEGKNGESVDISKELLESRTFIRKITEEIEKQIGINKYGKSVNKSII